MPDKIITESIQQEQQSLASDEIKAYRKYAELKLSQDLDFETFSEWKGVVK